MFTGRQMNMIDILPILPVELEDASRLIDAVAQGEIGMPPAAFDGYRDLIESAVKNPTGTNLFLGSRHNSSISGVLLCTRPEGGVATIIWLIVSPRHRGLGHGAALFHKACTWAKGCGGHKIKLTASSRKAVRFYEHLGMTVEGFHRSHWWKLDFWSLGMQV